MTKEHLYVLLRKTMVEIGDHVFFCGPSESHLEFEVFYLLF